MTKPLHYCRYCDGLITEEAPGRRIAYKHGATGPDWEVWAHNEHAHLVQPDPRPLAILARIRARKDGRS